jgi:hypothetical protein
MEKYKSYIAANAGPFKVRAKFLVRAANTRILKETAANATP